MLNRKVILLLSGGFDSSVAGHLLQEQNYQIIPLHLSNVDFAGEDSIAKSMEISRIFGWEKMYVIDIADILQTFVDRCKHSYYFVLMKRFMLRLAGELAKIKNASYIGTGESLGQVSSQTLANISVIEQAAEYRVLKPLITFDKEKIIDYTRSLKIFDISAGPEICDLLGPKHPVTNAVLENAIKEESKLDVSSMIEDSMKSLQLLSS